MINRELKPGDRVQDNRYTLKREYIVKDVFGDTITYTDGGHDIFNAIKFQYDLVEEQFDYLIFN